MNRPGGQDPHLRSVHPRSVAQHMLEYIAIDLEFAAQNVEPTPLRPVAIALGDGGSHLRLSLHRIAELTSKTRAWTLLLIAQLRPFPQVSTSIFCDRETRRGR